MKNISKIKSVFSIIVSFLVVLCIAGCSQSEQVESERTSISGDWELVENPELATPDEAETAKSVYYTFSEPGKYGDGVYKTIYDGGVEEGNYKLSEKSGRTFINMGTEDLEYKIADSKLTITFPKQIDEETGKETPSKDYVFAPAEAPKYENESYDSFETDSELLSEWVTDKRTLEYLTSELSYKETVKFGDNGVMTIHYESEDLALDRYMYYAYTAKDGSLTFSLVTDKEKEYNVSYKTKDGKISFTDNTSSSIFADAFFGEVTYKKK